MGLVARAIEEAGIPTLCMSSALDITRAVKPPRSVFVNFPLGHQTGKPHDPALQRNILMDAFRAAEAMTGPGAVTRLPYAWDDTGDAWEDLEYRPGYLPAYTRQG